MTKDLSGFINILKPPGMTSHDVIGFVRKVLHIKRVGHAGTLDPAAAGVLPVAVGQAARLIEYLELADKVYRAEIQLGIATDSGDDTGAVIAELDDFKLPSKAQLEPILAGFKGTIKQQPPAHSAIKINGKRACDLLRQGKAVTMPTRKVTIKELELLAINQLHRTLLIDVACSKGTYIRSLCRDIGEALKIPATMAFLVRQQVGDFSLADTVTLEELADCGAQALLDPAKFLNHLEHYDLASAREKAFRNGLGTGERQHIPKSDILRVYVGDRFIGIGRYDRLKAEIVPVKVLGN